MLAEAEAEAVGGGDGVGWSRAGGESDGLVGNEGQEGGPMAETCVPKP